MVHPYSGGVVLPSGGFEAGGWRPESGPGLQRGSLQTAALSLKQKSNTGWKQLTFILEKLIVSRLRHGNNS